MGVLTLENVFTAVYNAYNRTEQFKKAVDCIKEAGKDVNTALTNAYEEVVNTNYEQYRHIEGEYGLNSRLGSVLGYKAYEDKLAWDDYGIVKSFGRTIESILEKDEKFSKLINKCNWHIKRTKDENKLSMLNSFKEEVVNAQQAFVNGMETGLENMVETFYGKGMGQGLDDEWYRAYAAWVYTVDKLENKLDEVKKAS